MNDHYIKVSVIIPVYNVEKYVEKSVLSILNQTLKNIEIIIINDGSTDFSLSILTELAKTDDRIRIISTQNNGLSIARNLGIYTAIGKYIYFFDSDDILENDTLEVCYQKCQSQNLDFLFFDADCFTDSSEKNYSFNYQRTHKYEDRVYSGIDILQKQIATNGYKSSACLSFIKRDYLKEKNLYFHPRIIHEDELFTFLLYLKAERVGLLKKTFFHRRVRENSIMTRTFGFRNAMGYITVCRELNKLQREYTINTKEKPLIRKRIEELLYSIINKMTLNSTEDFKEIKKIITFEFEKMMPWKLRFMLKWPHAYNTLSKVKQRIKQ